MVLFFCSGVSICIEKWIFSSIFMTSVMPYFLSEPFCLTRHKAAFYSVMYNPIESSVIATANNKNGVALWDIRMPFKWFVLFFMSPDICLLSFSVSFCRGRQYISRKCYFFILFFSCLLKYGGAHASQSAMSIRFNSVGTKILALRRRLPPILYDIHSSEAINEFDSPGYYNSCTMKSCCFAGYNDEVQILFYILLYYF